jgi:hypothetical protein
MVILESFLRSRGNLKEMERALGISYPTVRARVEALVQALGLADGESPDPGAASEDLGDDAASTPVADAGRRAILEQLASRKIDAATAAEALRAIEASD